MRSTRLIQGLGLFILAGLLLVFTQEGKPDRHQQQLARLQRERLHVQNGTPAAHHIDSEIAKIRNSKQGEAASDHPDLFLKILHDMKVPADRSDDEYQKGYRALELKKAEASFKAAGTPLPWVERGPANVAGRVRGLLVDPSDPTGNTWFIGSVGGGVWKTPDAGANWTRVTPDPQSYATSTLAQCASQPDVIYAGTGESFFNIDAMNGNGMLKSIDHGVTWTPLTSTLDDPLFNNISRILVDPNDPDVVIVAATTGRYKQDYNTSSNIFKSIDGGASWTTVFTEAGPGNDVQDLKATPADFNVLYAGVRQAGVLKSIDAGDSWFYTNSGITDFTGRFELAVSPVNTSRLYAAAQGASGSSKLWISSDAGASWIQTAEMGSEPNWLGAQGWYDNTIVCDPTNADVVYVGGIQLWMITMINATQRQSSLLNQNAVHVDHHNLVVLPGTSGVSWRLLDANDGGVAVSSNMATGWSMPILGLNTTQFYGVDKKPGSSAYIGGMQDNGTWRSPENPDSLTPWVYQIGGDGYETSWSFVDPLKVAGGYQYNGILRSLDGGATWNTATSGLGDTGSSSAPFITKIGKSADAPDLLFAVGASGVWRSTDFGASWNLASMNTSAWAFSSFLDVKISRANPDVVWAGARMDAGGSIYLSVDGGSSFAPVPNYTTTTMGGISGLATHPTDDQTAYVLFSFAGRPKILRTEDQGQTWQDITGFESGAPSSNGFPDVAVYDLLVLPDQPTTLWAGTEIGLFESTDDGTSWHLADNGLPNVGIWALSAVEDEVVVATHGLGIWSVTRPSMVAGKTFTPLIENLYQIPTGELDVETTLRSAYDSTEVYMNGSPATVLPANTAGDRPLVQLPVTLNGTAQVQLVSHLGASTYSSPVKSISVFSLSNPVFSYATDFNGGNPDFAAGGLNISLQTGFSDEAIHSAHPYADNTTSTSTLTVPIRVAQSNATMEYDEVVLVEPGESGTVFGDFGFWDYVIVEGTKDGTTWLPLLDGYDSRYDPDWLSAYNSSQAGTQSLYRHHSLDLLNTFAWGDTILVRFRLYADAGVHAWGWAVDNLSIQVGSPTGVENTPAPRFTLGQNYPNPFNPQTSIRYTVPSSGRVSLKVYDQRGRLVRTLVDGAQEAGERVVVWDGRSDDGAQVASGIYLYQLKAKDLVEQRKMTLVK